MRVAKGEQALHQPAGSFVWWFFQPSKQVCRWKRAERQASQSRLREAEVESLPRSSLFGVDRSVGAVDRDSLRADRQNGISHLSLNAQRPEEAGACRTQSPGEFRLHRLEQPAHVQDAD